MSAIAEELKSQLAKLPMSDRAELARFLLESLHEDEPSETEAAWNAELNRRIAEIESGAVVGIPAEDVLAEMRRNFP